MHSYGLSPVCCRSCFAMLVGCIGLQHGSNLQSTFPFSSRCLFGARASPAGAGGGGQDPELAAPGDGGGSDASPELTAPGDGGWPAASPELAAPGVGSVSAASPELAAPGHGGVDGEVDVVGEGGEDIAKMPKVP